MTTDKAPAPEHWNSVYLTKPSDSVSWYRPHLDHSWRLLDGLAVSPAARFIDIGGGASTFVDDALDRGYNHVTVVDLAEAALSVARERLGARAAGVQWISGDITTLTFDAAAYDIWHDRAVFHFLTDPSDQAKYFAALQQTVAPGGYVVIGTFGPNGPEQCSGLPTLHLSGDDLFERLPDGFAKISTSLDVHTTPRGASQEFAYLVARRR